MYIQDGYEHSVFAKICDEDKEYVYRIHDDPYCERICVPVMPEDYELQLIHKSVHIAYPFVMFNGMFV